jgi:hypothetical protein
LAIPAGQAARFVALQFVKVTPRENENHDLVAGGKSDRDVDVAGQHQI